MHVQSCCFAYLTFCFFAVLVVVGVLINSGKISLFGVDAKSQFKMQFKRTILKFRLIRSIFVVFTLLKINILFRFRIKRQMTK